MFLDHSTLIFLVQILLLSSLSLSLVLVRNLSITIDN